MDMISDLPDCILLHILSFLPTKTAFLTTVLSRRWTHLCHHLQHLHFKGITIPSPPPSWCRYHLPSLKTLQLYNVKTSVGNLEELLSHCTALETLVLDSVCRFQEEGQLSICFPSLKSLHFKSYWGYTVRLLLVIDTPSLKRLYIQALSGFREIRVRNLHNVEEASIDIYKQSSVLEFLVELCRIRILELGLSVFDCLPEAPPHRIPELTCLQRLELTVRCFDTRYIMDMLHKCPMLKLLAIGFNALQYIILDPHPSRKWEHPVRVPTCLASHLQVIKIKRYVESRDDRDFFAYVLQHGLVLESLDIQVDRSRAKGFPEELSLLPRSSKACQINFCWIPKS